MTALGMTFESVLAQPITMYVRAKSAVGCQFAGEARLLRLFDRFLLAQHIGTPAAITNEVIEAFLASRPLPRPRATTDCWGPSGGSSSG